jgi:hypothetical protein
MPPPSPAVTERVNNPECRVAILSLDQLRVRVPHLLVAVDEVINCGPCLLQRKLSLLAQSGHSLRRNECPLSGGEFNRSTQHLLILLEEEVCDGGDCTDMVHAAAEG